MLALVFCVASGLCYAEAAIRQRRLSALAWRALGRDGGWWFAVALSACGGVLHVAALRFGPVTLVQPLGALTLVFALPLGALRREQRATASEWQGAAVTAAALTGLVLLTAPAPAPAPAAGTVLTIGGWSAAVVAVLWLISRGTARRPLARTMARAAGAGVAFGATSALARVLTAWTGGPALIAAEAVMIAAFALTGLALTQASYRDSGLGVPLGVQAVVNPVASAAIGISALGEGYLGGGPGIALACLTGLAMTAGIALLARGESARAVTRSPGGAPAGSPTSGRADRIAA
jgi:hypothetical protein